MNKSIKTDGELVDSILSSNKDDFRILVERYQQRIFSYLYRLLHQNRDGALDITQSVFLKVYQNLNTYDKKRPMQAWIYRIAHNEAANHLRSISRRRESLLMKGNGTIFLPPIEATPMTQPKPNNGCWTLWNRLTPNTERFWSFTILKISLIRRLQRYWIHPPTRWEH